MLRFSVICKIDNKFNFSFAARKTTKQKTKELKNNVFKKDKDHDQKRSGKVFVIDY